MKVELKIANGYAEIKEEWKVGQETKYLEAAYSDKDVGYISVMRANRVLVLELLSKLVVDGKELPITNESIDDLFPKDYDLIVLACQGIQNGSNLKEEEKKS